MSTISSVFSTNTGPLGSTPEFRVDGATASVQGTPTAGEIHSGEEDDILDYDEQADLECQLYMQDTLDLLAMVPKFFIKAFLEELGVRVPQPVPGMKTTTFELVDMALHHLHAFMHAGGDVAGVYASLRSLVDDIVAAGHMDDPWADNAEPPTLLDIHRELVSYVDQSLEHEIQLLVAKLDCKCLPAAKTLPTIDPDVLTDALLEHLQHRLEDEKDLSTEADVIRSFRRQLIDDSDEESDNADPEPIEPLPVQKQSSVRTTTKQPVKRLTKEQNLALIAQLQADLRTLPRDIIVDVCNRHLKWMQPEDKTRKPSKNKKNLIGQMGKLLRAKADHRTDVSRAVRQVEDAVNKCCERQLKHTINGALRPRGRSPVDSKRLKAIGVEFSPDGAALLPSDAASFEDEARTLRLVRNRNITTE